MNNQKSDHIPEEPFHSSGYAQIASGGSIGSTNDQTFSQRTSIDQNRTSIRKYRDSHIGRGALRHHARKGATDPYVHIDPVAHATLQSQNATDSSVKPTGHPATPPPSTPQANFKEPPTRGFNPYS